MELDARAVAEFSGEPVVLFSLKNDCPVVSFLNDAAASRFGFSTKSHVPSSFLDDESRGVVRAALRDPSNSAQQVLDLTCCFEGGRKQRCSFRARCFRNAELLCILDKSTTAASADSGELEAKYNSVIARLAKSESRFDMFFSSNILGVLVTRLSGEVLRANRAFLDMVGYSQADVDSGALSLGVIMPPDHDLNCEQRQSMMSTGIAFPFEMQYLRRDGSRVDVITALAMVSKETGECIAYVVDITKRKQAERAALAASQAKSFFVANISHEVRTPLNGICGMSELLLESSLSPQQRESVEIISRSASNLVALISELLDFSKMEIDPQKMRLCEVEFNPQAAVEEVVELIGETANAKGIELLYSTAVDLPNAVIGDPNRLRQILLNLVGNAIKFTEEGEVEVSVSSVSPAPEPHLAGLRFDVRDTGPGIAADDIGALFQPFSQLDNGLNRKHTGTGLGLAISKQLVTMMRGEISVSSEVGRGSVFTFTVFLPRSDAKPDTSRMVPLALLAGLPGSPFSRPAKTVLLCEKNAALRRVVVGWLSQCQCVVTAVETVDEAVRLVRAAQPAAKYDVVLLSPDPDAAQLFAALDACPANAATPVVVLHSSRQQLQPELQSPRVCAFVLKPLQQTKLFDAFVRAVSDDRKRARSEDASAGVETRKRPRPTRCVLCVDDNAINQKVVARQLDSLNVEAAVVGNGLEALQALEENPNRYAMILMDMQMPVMCGLQTTQEIRKREAANGSCRIPVVALTANAMEDAAAKCLAAGMDGVLVKPTKLADLRSSLMKHLPGFAESTTTA